MANQEGIIKIKGTIGDITFFKTKEGYKVRQKGGVDGSRILNDPAFKRTRENGEEFGNAGRAGKLIRMAFKILIQDASDSRLVSRLTKKMVEVIKADAISVRGKRNVIDGELALFEGFDFNIDAKLSSIFYAPFVANIDRTTGKLNVTIANFVPNRIVNSPTGATHFVVSIAGAEIDFENEILKTDYQYSNEMAISDLTSSSILLEANIGAGSTKPLVLVFGIHFYQQINGISYLLKGGNALQCVKVDGGV